MQILKYFEHAPFAELEPEFAALAAAPFEVV
jgi:hypothetical protein